MRKLYCCHVWILYESLQLQAKFPFLKKMADMMPGDDVPSMYKQFLEEVQKVKKGEPFPFALSPDMAILPKPDPKEAGKLFNWRFEGPYSFERKHVTFDPKVCNYFIIF